MFFLIVQTCEKHYNGYLVTFTTGFQCFSHEAVRQGDFYYLDGKGVL